MAEKIVLAKLDIDIQALLKAANESKLAIVQLKNELLALEDAADEAADEFEDLQEQLEELTTVMDLQTEVLQEQVKNYKNLASEQSAVAQSARQTSGAQQVLTSVYDAAADAVKDFTATSLEAKQVLDAVGQSISSYNAVVSQSTGATTQGTKTFNDFRNLFKESAQSINIFNGDFGDFITRAQEAGGVGPLVTGALNGMATGIAGMTKAALAFLATPLGITIAALAAVLSPVINYLKNTQEGIDKVTAVTRPLQSVFEALMGVFQRVGKVVVDAFTNPQKALEAFGKMFMDNIVNRVQGMLELVPALGKAVSLLFEGEFAKAGKVAADAVGKVALGTNNITDKVAGATKETGKFFSDAYSHGQKLDNLQKALDKGLADYTKKTSALKTQLDAQNSIADDTNKTFAQREAAAAKAIITAQQHSALMVQRLDQEIQLLKLKQASNGVSDAEKAALAEMVAKRDDALASGVAAAKSQSDKLNAIRRERNDKAREDRQKAIDDVLTKHKQELDLFIAKGSAQAKTLKESLKFEEDKYTKSKTLLDDELKYGKISKAQYDKALLEAENTKVQNITQLNLQAANSAISRFEAENKSKLEGAATLTQQLIDEEANRLATIRDMHLNQLALEKGIDQQKIAHKIAANQELTMAEQAYLDGKRDLDNQYNEAVKTNQEAFDQQTEQKATEKKAVDKEIKLAEAQTEYEEKLILEDERHQNELLRLEQMLTDKKITQEQYDILEREEAQKTSDIKKQLAIQNAQSQLGTMQNVAGAIGEAFGQNKEMALAQATMNAGQAIISIWSGTISGNPLADSIIKGALTASTAMKTAKQIKEIQSAKKPKQPKFRQGGLMSIGGNRHSSGGTMFHGADGTTFEAEQGELIGVMNRNAAHHFMAFNNAFPAGGASVPNYFAGGGIVSREIASPSLNIDELATKIAMANSTLPVPVVAVEDVIAQSSSYVQVRDGANF